MDLNHALQKHAEWKVKFRSAMSRQESLDVPAIAKDNCCELGKWLHGDGRMRFAGLASFAACVQKHAIFHAEAAKVAQAINRKRFAEAEAMMEGDTPYMNASSDVGVAIMRLKKEALI